MLAGGVTGEDIAGLPISPFDVRACLRRATEAAGIKRRRNAAIGTELLFSASREAFEDDASGSFVDRSLRVSEADREAVDPNGADEQRAGRDSADLSSRERGRAKPTDRAEVMGAFKALLAERFTTAFLTDGENVSTSDDLPRGLPRRWAAVLEGAEGPTRETLARFDPRKIQEFLARILVACSRKSDWTIACWRLDLDETTPHLSVFIVPTYTKVTKHTVSTCVSVRHHFGQPAKLSALQDWIGGECKPLGLVRGRPRTETNARHLSPRKYRAIQRYQLTAAAAAQAAEAERMRAAEDRETARKAAAEVECRLAELDQEQAALDRLHAQVEEAERRVADREAHLTVRLAEAARAERDLLEKEEAIERQRTDLKLRRQGIERAVSVARTVLGDCPGFGGRSSLLATLSDALPGNIIDAASDIGKALERWSAIAAKNSANPQREPEDMPETLAGFEY
ncbi:hypothetical protein [Jiella sp. M17.18]|uniref:hypothetical protein n=1 Tax=Jiella sp. M17.18 TaxID=3234247 RepID=UPI0034DE7AEE